MKVKQVISNKQTIEIDSEIIFLDQRLNLKLKITLFIYNPLTNYYAKQNIQNVFYLNDLKLVFQNLSRFKTNKHLKFETMKNIMKQILNRQIKGQERTLDFGIKINFLSELTIFIGNFDEHAKTLQKNNPSSKEENIQFVNEMKIYFKQSLKQIKINEKMSQNFKDKIYSMFLRAQRFGLIDQNIKKSLNSKFNTRNPNINY